MCKRLHANCPRIIMISHNMDEVAKYCNRVAVMSDGKLYGVFAPRELFAQTELLRSLHIEPPSVAAIAETLNARGFTVDASIIDEDELVEAIVAEWKRRHDNA